ncbi:gliding motility-associated C-terminal domain-containing protein, partial [Aquimarina sp. 2201CG5-10]|uniref:DUF7507 domain-containing protein n=1 Tax=Aquimarina callyspongiae TaxID=3098150 RepID=UPI002AB32ED1
TTPGDTVTFTVTVSNSGPNNATGVVVTDQVPNGYTIVGSPTASQGTYVPGTGVWTVGSINNGSNATLTIVATVNATGTYVNVAEITASDNFDPDSIPNNDVLAEDDQDDADPGVSPVSDLDVAKGVVLTTDADTNIVISAGDTVTFTVTVSNSGPNDATGVAIGDVVPDGYTAISNISDGGIFGAGIINWTGLSVTSGSSILLTYEAVVTDTGNYTNFVEITASDNFDPDSTPDSTPDTDVPTEDDETNFTPSVPELTFTKTSSVGGTGAVGDIITYTFSVENTGNVAIDNVTIDDTLTGSVNLPVTPSTLAPGAIGTATATYTITQVDIDAGVVSNSATVEGDDPNNDPVTDVSDNGDETTDGPDPDSDPTNDPTDTTLTQNPELTLTKTSSVGGTGAVGDIITYTFSVENTGNVTIDNVTIDDTLTGSVNLPVTPSTLAPGAIGTATATYTITQVDIDAGVVSNSATVEGDDPNGDPVTDVSDNGDETTDGPDPDSDPTNDPTDTTLTQNPELTLTKTSSVGGTGAVGDIITYTFSVENTGNVTIDNVTIDDVLTGSVNLPIAPSTLAPGAIGTATATYTITQADIDAGVVSNSATVEGDDPNGDPVTDVSDNGDETTDGPDPDSDPTNDPTDTVLVQNPELTLVKTGVAEGSTVGDIITYTFTVTNTGNVTIDNITIDDTLTGSVNLPIVPGALAPGESGTATATYTITQDDINLGEVENSAVAIGQDPDDNDVMDVSDSGDETIDEDGDGDPTNDPTITMIEQFPNLALTKTGIYVDTNNDGLPNVGDEIRYTFTVENTGNVDITNIVVTDPLPGIVVTGGPIDLAVGEIDTNTFTAVYVLTAADVLTGSVTNQALATGLDPNVEDVTDLSDDPSDTTDLDLDSDGDGEDETIVTIELEDDIVIYTGISPNGDGTNDQFRIVGLNNFPNNTLQIFNRWGVMVFDQDGYEQPGVKLFEGISEGRVTISENQELPVGTYYYVLEYENANGVRKSKAGYLYINR